MQKLYENIKRFRTERNLSQQELADMLGYKNSSVISKIEAGHQNLPLSKIRQFAEVLGVNPGDLMGWHEDVKILSWDEEALLASYRSLNEKSKEQIRSLASDFKMLRHHVVDE